MTRSLAATAVALAAPLALTTAVGLAVPAAAQAATGPDYAATSWTGPATVTPGATFTRTLVVGNVGGSGGTWPATATVRGINLPVASVSSTGFQRCSVVKFTSGAMNYIRCSNAYLAPGATATMTVTFRAPVAGWDGWVYQGNGYVTSTSMEIDADRTNDNSGLTASTTVVR